MMNIYDDEYADYSFTARRKIKQLKETIANLQWELDNMPDALRVSGELEAMGLVEDFVIEELFNEKLRQTPEQFEKTLRQFFIDTINKRL